MTSMQQSLQKTSGKTPMPPHWIPSQTPSPPTEGNRRISHRACLNCRQMKMKCEGAANPPCVRCRKARRVCVPQLPKEHSGTYEHSAPLLGGPATVVADDQWSSKSTEPPYVSPLLPLRKSVRTDLTSTELPSIFSASPVNTVEDQGISKRRRLNGNSPVSSTASLSRLKPVLPLPFRDLSDMLLMFIERVSPDLFALSPRSFQSEEYMVQSELPVLYAACYTMALYIPDGKAIRKALEPEIIKVLKGSDYMVTDETEHLSNFKALMLLYIYSDRKPPPSRVLDIFENGEVQFWAIKSRIETDALYLSLPNSVRLLKADIDSQVSNITETVGFQKYMLWLQLFLAAHYYSLICGTPPTIRIDGSIRIAPQLLQNICQHPQSRILGEVELCLIWEQASTRERGLCEWWSSIDVLEVDDEAIESTLTYANSMIDEWYNRWNAYMTSGQNHSQIMDYHGRITRFFISSYAVRHLKKFDSGLTALQSSQIKRCILYANKVLDFVVNLRPIQKDKLRYLPGSSSIMISFCCHFLLSACQDQPLAVADPGQYFDNVAKVAQLLIDLAPDTESKAHANGVFLLSRVGAARKSLDAIAACGQAPRNDEENVAGLAGQPWNLHPDSQGMFNFGRQLGDLESYWDFSMLFPGNH